MPTPHTPTPKLPSLSPCPFCGAKHHQEINSNGIGDYYIRCDGCGASTSDVHCETYQQAAERWNTRAKSPADAALVAALQVLLDFSNMAYAEAFAVCSREVRKMLAGAATSISSAQEALRSATATE